MSTLSAPTDVPRVLPSGDAPAAIQTGARRFQLTWNSSKVKTRNPNDRTKFESRTCTGVLFPAGSEVRVALSTGQTFMLMSELEHVLSLGGEYGIMWEDNEG